MRSPLVHPTFLLTPPLQHLTGITGISKNQTSDSSPPPPPHSQLPISGNGSASLSSCSGQKPRVISTSPQTNESGFKICPNCNHSSPPPATSLTWMTAVVSGLTSHFCPCPPLSIPSTAATWKTCLILSFFHLEISSGSCLIQKKSQSPPCGLAGPKALSVPLSSGPPPAVPASAVTPHPACSQLGALDLAVLLNTPPPGLPVAHTHPHLLRVSAQLPPHCPLNLTVSVALLVSGATCCSVFWYPLESSMTAGPLFCSLS